MRKLAAKIRKTSRQDVSSEVSGYSDGTTSAAAQPLILGPSRTDSFPDGIKVLHDCPNATLDICFIHGLTGNRDSTWTAEGQLQPWPQALLPSRLRRSRILTYGYDAYVTRGLGTVATSNRLIDHASNFLNDLTTNRTAHNALRRPLVFVAHSLGGLVCKEMILNSRNNPEPHLKAIFAATKGIIFMGTPHTGSWMADWADIPAKALGLIKSTNRSLLKILQTNDQFLESIQQRFQAMIRDILNIHGSIEITCFYEELPLPVAGKVVSKESAMFPGYNLISIHANHRDMVRFSNDEETGFKRVVGELLRWEAEIISQTKPAANITALPLGQMSEDTRDLCQAASLDDLGTGSVIGNFETGSAVALPQVSAPKRHQSPSRSFLKKAAELFGLDDDDDDDRCIAAVEKCFKMLNLKCQVEKIASLVTVAPEDVRKSQSSWETDARQKYQDACARCLRSFSFSEMGAREAIIEPPLQDTCRWIYTTSAYRSWATKATSILWIKGKPGSGKSTLMKALCAQRLQAANATSALLLPFFFNARGAIHEKSPVGLYLALMHSLLRQSPILRCEFLPKFMEKESWSAHGSVTWQTTEIESLFHSMITQKQQHGIEILIDALDECKEDEVRAIIRRFERSIDIAKLSNVPLSICWSSRHYPAISMLSMHGVELSMDQYNSSDIKRFVECELPERLDPLLLSFQDEIISRANGVFLWAVLVCKRMLKAVDQGKTEQQLQERLNAIPVELDDLFDDIFRKIGTATQEHKELVRIAQWILCAFEPLTLAQLHAALNSHSVKGRGALENPNPTKTDLARFRRHVNDVSGGLFEVTDLPGHFTRVQVIHETVREYLLSSKGCSQLLMPSRQAFLEDGHKELALACFRAFLTFDYHSVPAQQQNPTSLLDEFLASIPAQPQLFDHPFIASYALRYGFYHYTPSRHLFPINSNESSSLDLTGPCRHILINYMRLCFSYSRATLQLPADFRSNMRMIVSDEKAFGVTTAELTGLVTIIVNLYSSSEILVRFWGISLRSVPLGIEYGIVRHGQRRLDFVAVFCQGAGLSLYHLNQLEVFFTTRHQTHIMWDRARPELAASHMSFVMALQFSVDTEEEPKEFAQRLCEQDFESLDWVGSLVHHFDILRGLESIDWLPEDKVLWSGLEHDGFHKHEVSTQVCILFQTGQDSTCAQDHLRGTSSSLFTTESAVAAAAQRTSDMGSGRKARFVSGRRGIFGVDDPPAWERFVGRSDFDELDGFDELDDFERLLRVAGRFSMQS